MGFCIVIRVCFLDTKTKCKETIEVKLRFYYLLELAIKTLTSKGIDPADILNILPLNISSQFQSEEAITIDSIFKEEAALDKELKWYSFSLLQSIIDELCNDECKLKLKDYVKTLKNYLQSRLVPNITTCSSPCRKIMVDPEWSQKLVGSESDLSERDFIASLLKTTSSQVDFF